MIAITQRGIALLEMICESAGPVTARRLAELLHTSERAVRYDLALLTDWLGEQGLALKSASRKGYYFEESDREKALAALQQVSGEREAENRVFSSTERVCMIIIDILEEQSNYTFEEAAQRFRVSRATFVRDLEKADGWFTAHGVPLLRKQRRGFRLDVDETVFRRLIVDFVSENTDPDALLDYFMSNSCAEPGIAPKPSAYPYINRIFSAVDLSALIDTTVRYLKERDILISDERFVWLVYCMAITISRLKDGHSIQSLPREYASVMDSPEQRAIAEVVRRHLSAPLPEETLQNEAAYLAAHVYALAQKAVGGEGSTNSEAARSICTLLLERIQQQTGCDLTQNGELVSALKTHLQAALMRVELHIPTYNQLLPEIKRKFPQIFQACAQVAAEIAPSMGVSLEEGEIGSLALYIAVAIQKEKIAGSEPQNVRAVLICGMGIATTAFLTNSLKLQFSSITIVGRLSVFDLNRFDFSKVDLVFTTIDIPVPLPRPIIKVSPMLTRLDVRRIDAFLRTRQETPANTTQEFKIGELLGVISKYCDVKDRDRLAKDLKQYVEPDFKSLALTELPSLLDILPKKHVQAGIQAHTWEEAVRLAAQPLIDSGCATEDYVQEIISIKDRYNQYSFIANGVCMPHAPPSMLYKLSCSMATLKTPVEIELEGQRVPVRVIMVLSLSDLMTQAKALDEIFSLLDEFPDMPTELQQAATSTELCKVFKQYYDRLF